MKPKTLTFARKRDAEQNELRDEDSAKRNNHAIAILKLLECIGLILGIIKQALDLIAIR